MYLRTSSLRFLICVGRIVLSTLGLSMMIHSPETKGSYFWEPDLVERFGFVDFRFMIAPIRETLPVIEKRVHLTCPRFRL